MRSTFLLLLAVLTVGCATNVRLERFDTTIRAYERALRWSDFQAAFVLAGNADTPPPDFRRLQNIRVTSYETLGAAQGNDDTSRMAQVVEIRYVNVANMSERVLTDQQVWVYSESDRRWRLRSVFPVFP